MGVGDITDGVRKIIHIDMDYFYAQVEEREDPSLNGKPIAVGGNSDRRGVLCTSNYIAREYGVRSAMSTKIALSRCSNLIVIKPNFSLYKEISENIRSIFKEYTDLIEPLSLDEAYLDVTENPQHGNSATLIAQDIRQKIWDKERLTASAGIAPNKFLAKVASDWKKPNGQFTIAPRQVEQFILQLNVKKISGVGPVMTQKLNDMQIYTCADLQRFTIDDCIKHFGKMGIALYERARGIDHKPVVSNRIRKSLSVEETYARDLPDLAACLAELPVLLEKLEERLARSQHKSIHKLFVKVKFSDFSQTTVEHIDTIIDLQKYQPLMKEAFLRGSKAVRLLGVGVRFKDPTEDDFEQLSLLDE